MATAAPEDGDRAVHLRADAADMERRIGVQE